MPETIIKPDAPEGFEHTGEYRTTNEVVWYINPISNKAILSDPTDMPRWILRKVEPVIPPVPNDGKPAKSASGTWYEFIGEYRKPKNYEEYYWAVAYGAPMHGIVDCPVHIMRKVEKPEAPKGYEHTDEYRDPDDGEFFISKLGGVIESCTPASDPRCVGKPRWILRKAEPLPVWYHEGTRVYKREQGGNGHGGWDNAQFDARMEHDAKHAVDLLNEHTEQ